MEEAARAAQQRATEARRFFEAYPAGRKPLLMRWRTWDQHVRERERTEYEHTAASRDSQAASSALYRLDDEGVERFAAEARARDPAAARLDEVGRTLQATVRVRELVGERAVLVGALRSGGPRTGTERKSALRERLDRVLRELAYGERIRAGLTDEERAGYRREAETNRLAIHRARTRGLER